LLAARAGKHVLCEKPLGLTPEETDRMVAACAGAKVKLGTALMMRFHSQHQAALKLIQDGRLGRLTYGRAQLSCWYPPIPGAWRQDPNLGGGGALMDLGGHCIDLLEMFFGPVATVSCFTRNQVHAYPAEDGAVAMLAFASGALGTVDTFFCIPDNSSKNVLEIYGSLGSIIAQGTIGQGAAGEMTAFLEEAQKGYDATQARPAATGGLTIKPAPVNLYRAEIEEFSQAILEKREPANSAELGTRSQKVLTACYRSARTGRAESVA
jgi:predicted dehydrogenase